MDANRWKKIKEVYDRALDLSGDERAGFLAEACAGDADLRREVESLLTAHEDAGSFLQSPAVEVAAREIVADEAASPAPQLIGRELANYRIVSLLGMGGMGEVYLAEDNRLHRKVALKLLPLQFTNDAERVRRFEREAHAVSTLNHPNIMTIFEIGQAGGLWFMATELIEGQTPRRRLAAGEPMPPHEVIGVSAQIADALAAAHETGVVHRDIKPENVMLRRDGYVKVLDFGLAQVTERQTTDDRSLAAPLSSITEAGTVMGTVSYMSPEQARGQEMDERTDIFSLGVVMYEMLAGRLPFEGATASDMIASILRSEPPALAKHSPQTPAELEAIVMKALAKDREARWQKVELDPVSLNVRSQLCRALYLAHRYDEAIAASQELIQMEANYASAWAYLCQSYTQQGMHTEAVSALQKADSLAEVIGEIRAALGHAYAAAGRRDEAQKAIADLKTKTSGFGIPYHLATVYAALGQSDEAFNWLTIASDRHDPFVVNRVRTDPKLDLLRNDPRFNALLQRIEK